MLRPTLMGWNNLVLPNGAIGAVAVTVMMGDSFDDDGDMYL